jgi:class 3 adenylate cyclase
MPIDYDALSLTELIKLRDEIERETRARYQRSVVLVFTDVVGSTAYFERFGDAAGRALLQRHLDLLGSVLSLHDGRIVDTAGDGAFCVFERLLPGLLSMSELQALIARDNSQRAPEHQLGLRIGLHLGEVLTDGAIVTGDAVHLAARICSTSDAGQIVLSQSTAHALPPTFRVRCRPLPAAQLKGFAEAVPLAMFGWRDPRLFPSRVLLAHTGEELDLPCRPTVRFGRLSHHEGQVANEIVLQHPNPEIMRRISRWHFELVQQPNGLYLRTVSRAQTEVDGVAVPIGQSVQVHPGSVIRVAYGLELRLLSPGAAGGEETLIG